MGCVAVFVDAGYLFSAGSGVVAGAPLERRDCSLDLECLLQRLVAFAEKKSEGARFLRVYWYDGLVRNRLTIEQRELAFTDGIKLRLGVVNESGQQKGVDSRIVLDLLELARNGAITDAVLLSGDEDVRIGVQLAQSYGVRVHLLGIEPSRSNQSDALIQEADTTDEWAAEEVNEVLQVTSDSSLVVPKSAGLSDVVRSQLDEVAQVSIGRCSRSQIESLAQIAPGSYLPPEIHGPLLGDAGNVLGRFLDSAEKNYLRESFIVRVKQLSSRETASP